MNKRLFLSHTPLWFGAIFALVYVTGYFIDFFQYSRDGIVDNGEDILKLRYIQIGINFFILFTTITAPIFFLLFGRARMQPIGHSDLPPITIISCVSTLGYFLSVYYAAIFTPPGYFYSSSHPYRLLDLYLFLFFIPVGALILMWIVPLLRTLHHSGEKRLVEMRRLRERYFKWYTAAILGYTIYFDVTVFDDMTPDLKEMLYPFGAFFFLLCLMFSMIAYRMFFRVEGGMKHQSHFAKVGYTTLFVLLLIGVFYLTVVSYAYAVFPHIPSVKGGADHRSSPVVSVKLQPPISEDGIGPPVEDPEMSRMVIIYSTSNSIYVADACQWRQDRRTASITQINRRVLRYVVVKPEKPIKELTDCPGGK